VTALYRYLLADLIRGQRYLPPLVAFGVVVVVGSRGDGGPLLPLYGLWTGAMLVCSVWLTMVVLADEDPVQERITIVNARRRWHPLAAAVVLTLSFCLLLTIFGLGLPLVVGVRPASAADLVVGGLSQLASACCGATVGLFCSRKVIPRPGYALLLAALLVVALLLVSRIPLVNALIRLLSEGAAAAAVGPQVAAIGAASVALLVGGIAVVQEIDRRH
jgi:hypothetical protein